MYELKHYLVLKLKRMNSRFLKNGGCKAFNIAKDDKKVNYFLTIFQKFFLKHMFIYIFPQMKKESARFFVIKTHHGKMLKNWMIWNLT